MFVNYVSKFLIPYFPMFLIYITLVNKFLNLFKLILRSKISIQFDIFSEYNKVNYVRHFSYF